MAYYRRHYVPEAFTLVVVGDDRGWQFPERDARDLERVSAADVIAAARRYLVRPTVVVLRPPR